MTRIEIRRRIRLFICNKHVRRYLTGVPVILFSWLLSWAIWNHLFLASIMVFSIFAYIVGTMIRLFMDWDG